MLPTHVRHIGKIKKKGIPDVVLFLSVIFLALFGLLMVYNSSVVLAIRDFQDPLYYVREQARWFAIGITVFLAGVFIDYRKIRILAIPLLFITIGLLIAVFIPGLGVRAYGAFRWIRIGTHVFQSAELAKLTAVIYLAAWLSNPEKKHFVAFLFFLAVMVGLIVLEPDLGTAIILGSISVFMYFISGARLRYMAILIPLGITAIIVLSLVSPYRVKRLVSFINPESDPQGASYQVRQALIAVGSGGVTGVGLGKSRQKYEYLPEANTDSIFAIISEETGFVGSVFVILIFIVIINRLARISMHTGDRFGSLIAGGVMVWFGFQSVCNIGAIVSILPMTGIPLPLISYGGSNLVVMLAAFGLVLNISRYTDYG